MLKLRKMKIYLLVLLCLLLANPKELCSQGDCVFPTVTEDLGIAIALIPVTCVDGMGDYAVLGGTPPYQLWERDLLFSPDWYPVGDVNNIFSHTCSSDGVSSCGLDLEIKIIDSMAEESNVLPITDPGTCGQLQPGSGNPELIECGFDETISVESGCGPFTWESLSTGYTLTDTGDERSKILSCVGGTCGDDFDVVAEIRVTDDCGRVVLLTIRNSVGEWKGCGSSIIGGCDSDGAGYRDYYFSYEGQVFRFRYTCWDGISDYSLGCPGSYECGDIEIPAVPIPSCPSCIDGRVCYHSLSYWGCQ